MIILKCSYCGYEREGQADSAFYCGPHVASFGGATYPKVKMVPKADRPLIPTPSVAEAAEPGYHYQHTPISAASGVVPVPSPVPDGLEALVERLRSPVFGTETAIKAADVLTALRAELDEARDIALFDRATAEGARRVAAAHKARAETAERERAEEWRRRRDAEGSRDTAYAACETMRMERDTALARNAETAKAVRKTLTWAEQRCPCSNEQPNPCPLCGASVENLEACKSAENTIPRDVLDALRAAIRAIATKQEKAE